MKVQIHKVVGKPAKNGSRQVTILRGVGSQRRSDTRHIRRQGAIWVGNNPDPEAKSQRAVAATRLSKATSEYGSVQDGLDVLRQSLTRELTEKERTPFWVHGILTDDEIKATIVARVIPVHERRLVEAKMNLDSAKAYNSAIEEAFPAKVQFVGEGL